MMRLKGKSTVHITVKLFLQTLNKWSFVHVLNLRERSCKCCKRDLYVYLSIFVLIMTAFIMTVFAGLHNQPRWSAFRWREHHGHFGQLASLHISPELTGLSTTYKSSITHCNNIVTFQNINQSTTSDDMQQRKYQSFTACFWWSTKKQVHVEHFY